MRGLVLSMLAVVLASAAPAGIASAAPRSMVVLPFSFFDTSGEARDQTAAHAERLSAMQRRLQDGLVKLGYRVVPLKTPVKTACPDHKDACLLRIARQAGAALVFTGSVQKASTLISDIWAGVFDAESGRKLRGYQLTFRGDTDEAWSNAGGFLARQIEEHPPAKP